MAFDIDKMKQDGVSDHLMKLASMSQDTLLLLVARRLEHDKLYQQLMASVVGDTSEMYKYAIAAGIMSEYDRKWLLDEENPYFVSNEQTPLVPGELQPGGNSGQTAQ